MSTYGWKNNGISLKSLKGSVQSLTDAGSVDTINLVTELTTTGAAAITLGDGEQGQIKIVKMIVDGGDATLTPTNFLDGTTLTFDNTDYAILFFSNGTWNLIGGNATAA